MTPEEYREAALRTEHTPTFITHARRALPPLGGISGFDANTEQIERATKHDHRLSRMMHAVLGMITELGELCDPLKKHLIYGRTLDTKNLAEERGDDCWYDNLFDDALEEELEDIWTRNIAKLRVRFPDKFTEEKALNRDLDAEAKALEVPASINDKPQGAVPLNPELPPMSDLPAMLRVISSMHFYGVSLATGRELRHAAKSAADALVEAERAAAARLVELNGLRAKIKAFSDANS